MDERGRNRTSKWDLIDDQRSLEDNGRENARAGNYRASPNDYRSYSSRHSSAHAAEDDPKYPADAKDVRSKYEPSLSVRDHASGNRGTWRNNSMDRDNRGFFEASTNWDDDGSRRDHDHSPRSSWKRPLRSTSRGRSRSRSRSPVRAYRHESGVNDRNRSKPEVPIQTCIDFTSGRCRRGSHCPFLHTSTRKQEDRKYDFEHREESIRGGKYSHHNAADAYYNDYARETLESKREYDTNSRWTSSNQGAEREPQRSASIPCTFFAAGTCRNGKFCRFSHQIPASNSSGETARDMRWRTDHGLEKGGQKDLGTKFSDTVDPHATEYGKEGKWRTNGSPNRVDQINPHVFEHGKESHGKVISPLHNSKVVSSSVNGGWGNNIEASYVAHSGRTPIDKVVEVEANQSSQWKSDNPGNVNSVSELKGVDNWIGDKMSPEWNPEVPSARTVAKEDPTYAIQTSGSGSHDIPPETVQLMHYVSSAMPDEAEINDASGAFSYDRNLVGIDLTKIKSSFLSDNPAQLSTQNVPIGAPGILNAVGQGQFLLAPNHPGTENASANTNSSIKYDMYSKSIGEDRKASEATSCATPASKIVRQEQLAQLTDLSASLAHLLGKGHELPHFYASINPPNPVSSVEVSNGLVSQFPVETVQPYPPIGSKKPYEPVLDEAGQMQANTSVTLAQYPPNPGMNRTSEDVKQETPSAEQNGGEAYKSSYAESNLDHKQGTDSKPNKKPQTIHEGSAKRKDKHAKSQEGNPLENVDDEGKVDRGKKVKDTKALRDFKHALVNFVKELLKPAWKDGQIDKESFKTIVKKTVDKVTSTIQEASIPQTPEKVDQYLSASKPKLTKLVQAYVDRNLKKQT